MGGLIIRFPRKPAPDRRSHVAVRGLQGWLTTSRSPGNPRPTWASNALLFGSGGSACRRAAGIAASGRAAQGGFNSAQHSRRAAKGRADPGKHRPAAARIALTLRAAGDARRGQQARQACPGIPQGVQYWRAAAGVATTDVTTGRNFGRRLLRITQHAGIGVHADHQSRKQREGNQVRFHLNPLL